MPAHREAVTAVGAPAAIGPYVHAVRTGGLLFCSGQIPLDAQTGELQGSTHAEQAETCLRNLEAVCAAAGAQLSDAVKLTVYVTEMGAFDEVNRAYESFFSADPPARAVVGVSQLPRDAGVEIDAVVALPA